RALWLLEADPFQWHDRELVERALENVEYLVVQGAIRNDALEFASVVLPACAFPEQDGTYVNVERRIQRVRQILPPRGSAKPSWRIGTELLLRAEGVPPYFNIREILSAIAGENPAFAGIGWDDLAGEGVLLKRTQQAEVAGEPV
ncbi:MAG: molybdopterin-dependent oxidoreductase, partial [Armatimonadota bacterium]